jgi:hypothetical protein
MDLNDMNTRNMNMNNMNMNSMGNMNMSNMSAGRLNMDCKQEPYETQSYDRLNGFSLAMAYVPWQRFDQVLDAEHGLNHGTIFAELVLPFYGDKGACIGKRGAYE